MDSFGEYLRRERKLRGVTLEEIAKVSNISITYLKALESDDFESLPAEVFIRGFLRCYAQSSGMDGSEVILAYNSFIANKRTSRAASTIPIETPPKVNMKLSSFLAIVIFVVISSLMVFYYVKKSREVKPASVSERSISQGADEVGIEKSKNDIGIIPGSNTAEEESLIQTEDILEPQEEGISDNLGLSPPIEAEETSETKEVVGLLTLSMKAEDNAWINLIIDDTEIKEALLLPGETARWKAKEKFVVSLGNVAGTTLKLNDKDITLPKASANVIRDFTITLDNIKPQ